MSELLTLAGLTALIAGISIGIRDVFNGQPEGVYLVAVSCLFATFVLTAGVDDMAYKKGQVDAIMGYEHYEMVVGAGDTTWVEITTWPESSIQRGPLP